MGLILITDLGCDVCGAVFMASHGRVPNDGGVTKGGGAADEIRAAAKGQGWTRPLVQYPAAGKPQRGDVCAECSAKGFVQPVTVTWPRPAQAAARRANP